MITYAAAGWLRQQARLVVAVGCARGTRLKARASSQRYVNTK